MIRNQNRSRSLNQILLPIKSSFKSKQKKKNNKRKANLQRKRKSQVQKLECLSKKLRMQTETLWMTQIIKLQAKVKKENKSRMNLLTL